jgi:hypothetical protein
MPKPTSASVCLSTKELRTERVDRFANAAELLLLIVSARRL